MIISTQTKPISTNTTRGVVDPKFELSKKVQQLAI
jgi:hypothetical protein